MPAGGREGIVTRRAPDQRTVRDRTEGRYAAEAFPGGAGRTARLAVRGIRGRTSPLATLRAEQAGRPVVVRGRDSLRRPCGDSSGC
jgi:hypothetical protein